MRLFRPSNIVLFVVLCGGCIGLIFAQEPARAQAASPAASSSVPRQITTTGEGTATVRPDSGTWYVGVQAHGASAQQAQTSANAKARALTAALGRLHVPAKQVQTSAVSLSPSVDPQGTPDGFNAAISLTVNVPLGQVAAVGDQLVRAGADTLNGPALTSKRNDASYQLALKRAVAQARARAQALAQAAGGKLGPALQLNESGISAPLPYAAVAKADSSVGGSSIPISAGSLDVTASVTVVWQLR